jgi:hypothetical protein
MVVIGAQTTVTEGLCSNLALPADALAICPSRAPSKPVRLPQGSATWPSMSDSHGML